MTNQTKSNEQNKLTYQIIVWRNAENKTSRCEQDERWILLNVVRNAIALDAWRREPLEGSRSAGTTVDPTEDGHWFRVFGSKDLRTVTHKEK